jgi:MoaA/NifB/PqqE/SkfB family radical SAM enzyme/glycosyltransferase involved in cell wall biosynthesis
MVARTMTSGLVKLSRHKRPRISLVVPVSRGAEIVAPLIASLDAQTAAPDLFEVVLVTDDDAAYTAARAIVRVVRSPSRHPCVKRNVGAAAARSTDHLGFIDDDVKLDPGWVAAALAALDLVDVVTGPSNAPYSDDFAQRAANNIVTSPIFSLKTAMANPARAAVPYYGVSLCNVAMRRAVFDRVGGFNEVAPYWIDDAEFFFLAARERFHIVNDPDLRSAHLKRPVLWPLVAHYFRQRWHGGQSTWCFPELYLPQRGVRLAAGLLAAALTALTLALLSPQRALWLGALAAAAAVTTLAVALYGARSLSPSPALADRVRTGAATALATGATVLGFWLGLLVGPVTWLRGSTGRAHKAWRYRDRDAPFEGIEVAQSLGASVRSTVPHRVWTRGDRPNWLIYFVTARCNARCSMCFYWEEIEHASQSKELSLDEVRKLARSLPKLTYLSLSGGEPYLREDLADVVQALVDHADPVFVSIPTNGAFPERVVAAMDALTRRNPRTQFDIHLSLDGPPETHDRIRQTRAASYAQVMATHAAVLPLVKRRANLGLKFVVTVSTENIDVLEPWLETLADTRACDRIHLVPLHGNFKDRSLAVPHDRYMALAERVFQLSTRKGFRGLRHRLFTALKRASDEHLQQLHAEADLGRVCGAGQKIVVLGPYGDVLPCEPLQESVGNVRDHGYDVLRVLRGEAMRDFARDHLGPGRCNCNWGCAIGNAQVGDPWFYPTVAKHLLKGLLPR